MFNLLIYFCVLLMARDAVPLPSPTHGIKLVKIMATWEEADKYCRQEGAILASPINDEVLSLIKSSISGSKMYHIGTRAGHSAGTYVSVEGVPLQNMTTAMDSMVQELDPLDGDCLAIDRQSIRFVPCWTRLQYFCYTKSQSVSKIQNKTADYDCSVDDCCGNPEYKYYAKSNKCFKAYIEDGTWETAEQTCLDDGGQLAVVENENDKMSILDVYKFNYGHNFVYIGLRNLNRNGWKYVNGKPVEELYHEWSVMKVDIPSFDCAFMVSSGQLDNYPCDRYTHFICEKQLSI